MSGVPLFSNKLLMGQIIQNHTVCTIRSKTDRIERFNETGLNVKMKQPTNHYLLWKPLATDNPNPIPKPTMPRQTNRQPGT